MASAKELSQQIRYLPVQDSGRIKPFDTFARETLELVYGKKSYTPKEGMPAVPAHWVVLTWMLSPESWVSRPLFEVNHHDLLASLGLAKEKNTTQVMKFLKTKSFLTSCKSCKISGKLKKN